jgi:hypothetical protein
MPHILPLRGGNLAPVGFTNTGHVMDLGQPVTLTEEDLHIWRSLALVSDLGEEVFIGSQIDGDRDTELMGHAQLYKECVVRWSPEWPEPILVRGWK